MTTDNGRRQLIVEKSEKLRAQNHQIVEGLDELGALLDRYDPASSSLLNSIDLKSQDLVTYFFAAYSSTRDFEKAIMVYNTVKSLVRYILLMDRYYEVGNKRYRRMAGGILQSTKKDNHSNLGNSIDFALKQCWPFWEFENTIKQRLLSGDSFTDRELRHYNLFKSSDAPILYCRVLDNELESFTPNVAMVFHYNQAIIDILDDFTDIEDDVREKMPNVFMMASAHEVRFSELAKNPRDSRALVTSRNAIERIMSLSRSYRTCTDEISLPPEFEFLKCLSFAYASKLENVLMLGCEICQDKL